MRSLIVIALVLTTVFSLAGCKAAATTEAAAATVETPGALPVRQGGDVMSLAMGILRLKGTENAVGAEQATEMLPLWKAYRALLNSDATAPAELAALAEQMRESLTAAQVEAIDGAPLGTEEQAALTAKFGLEMPTFAGGMGGELGGDLTQEQIAARIAERQAAMAAGGAVGAAPSFEGRGMGPGAGGGPPQGGVIVGGGGFAAPEGFVPPAGFQGAEDGGAGMRTGANTWVSSLVDAVITYLEGLQ